MSFHFSNIEILRNGNKKTVRKVILDNNKGYKSVSKYINGKLKKTVKRKLKLSEKKCVKSREFLPQLFDNCKCKI
jgi:hypothetical protein